MADLAVIAKIPNVASAVLGDAAGGFLDAIREADGESVAAVTGFASTALARAGEELGLGPLRRVAVASAARALVVALQAGATVTLRVEPLAALNAVEKALDAHLGTGG